MIGGENERLTGDLKSESGEVLAAGTTAEIDKLGGIHVVVFRLEGPVVAEDQALRFSVPGGREIDLYVPDGGVWADGTVRAAVVNDTGQPAYGLGLEPFSAD